MIIKFVKVEDVTANGLKSWTCTNCISGHDISIHEDMLGDYVAIVEKKLEDGTFESYEEVFGNLERAMEWCEYPAPIHNQGDFDNPVCIETSFGA